MSENYTAEAIEVLSGLEPVQRRPGMYTDTTRPNHLAQEVIDNSVDEVLAGFASRIIVTLHEDGSIEVEDDGRGMPVDLHPQLGLSGVEVIMTRLHAGGKFSDKNYSFSGGLHGVGVSVVNALSERLDVTIKRNGIIYQMTFANGDKLCELNETGVTKKRDTGTVIRFWPNGKYFDTTKISVKHLTHVLRAKAVLCSGLSMTFINKITNEEMNWCYEQGLTDYLRQTLPEDYLPEEPFAGEFKSDEATVDWALAWSDSANGNLNESYVNLIPTIQGGTHVNGLRSGLFEALSEFCELRNLLPRGVKLTADDLWESCQYVLSVKMKEPQFAGQTKERLSSRQTSGLVSNVIKDAFAIWLNQHRNQGEAIAALAIERAQKRLKQAKQVARKRVSQGPALPGKLADCLQTDLSQAELFLVEGDSAGGSAKQARNKDYQAILPLRGKILNSWEVDSSQVLASQEIHDISVAIGVDPGSSDLEGLRYGKICILADADSDGAHIATLICALFLKHFKPLVKAGHVFVAMPPLYRIDAGKLIHYALDDEEKNRIVQHLTQTTKSKVNVQRFKGLGEMNPIQLRETTMDPNTRRLVQLTLDDEEQTEAIMDMMLNKKRAADRKVWLETKGNLAEI
ncbi:DNA topoisomerase IV subunit B [Legionella pneumophila]|uniref:DNA topoisomerase 4 subunit B n=1 Tax=Legionella pneumophila subsp. pascullei TaxID=91890 RepID=A0AAX2ISR9_LEGPN|nr:DNA topoisomerase IV subunit B [Legionella pneumophila]AMP90589.1 DNA topoisomerase IV subunit B [Legionella pneumophila subsp. pascullei]AMP91719.1 DNA topoisomerase IV subunit B [Legionella pneumophila subsp. pascullei]AMP94708.1 DNA topoisomerase IV subunit B [Legionella pneumophila subsp. pascullei]SQG89531.1 DNA topoisomerase IV subunit B [Legionella pneumophila subsp. pascullei]VEH04896.1 DNA topoisomerase IV subunit B [Legionella pneumophila subsp. pascullei]